MNNEFYTHVSVDNGKILYRGYEYVNERRKRVHGKMSFQPISYVPTEDESVFKTIYGGNLKPKKHDSISAARTYVKNQENICNREVYGYEPARWPYEFIARSFPDVLEVSLNQLNVYSFDIETKVGENGPPGVPDPYEAVEEITHIALQDYNTKKTYCLSTVDVTLEQPDLDYMYFETEELMLKAFIKFITYKDPDIMFAWYCNGFDTPYIINRIDRVLGEGESNALSPFGIIDQREKDFNGDLVIEYQIVGRQIYDLQALYMKFVLKKQESYSLDNISKVELGVGKLENPYNTFKEFYTNDPKLFAEYNIIDTQRLTQIEQKKGLVALAVTLTYLMKCTYKDVFSPVRFWECYIQSTLMHENKFITIFRDNHGREAIPGAYVSDPRIGFYEWLVSIDAASLYPSIMKGLNISPETFAGMLEGMTPEHLLNGDISKFKIPEDVTIAANGAMFYTNRKGIIPQVVDNALDGRKIAKKEMLRLKQLYVDTGLPEHKAASDLKNILQEALKVAANSLYGITLQPGFMFYDPRLGSAITLTGQFIIQHVAQHCDLRFNEFFKTKDINYSVYSDTDSIFFTFENIVDKYWSGKTDLEITTALDTLIETKLRPFIDESTEHIAKTQNYYTKTIFFKRENICSGGFWLAKKKYALKVYDSEGVRIPEGDYKIMGIEVVRSSTPTVVRAKLKKCVEYIIDKDIDSLRKVVSETESLFKTATPQEIAFPRTANNLEKYKSYEGSLIYQKGCPIAVRGALLYNQLIDKLDLHERYTKIHEGEKIKFIYLKEPNTIRENIISFVDELPKDFDLEKYIDRDLQFEKTFMKPIDGIMVAVGWKLEEEASLEEFFG